MDPQPPAFSPQTLEPDLPVDPELLWLACRRNWLPALSAFGIVVGLVAVAIALRPATYSATGKLLFRIDPTPLLTGIRIESSELTSLAVQNNPLVTETTILQSGPLLAQSIAALDLRTEEGELRSAKFLQERLEVKQAGSADILELTYTGRDPEAAAAIVNRLMALYINNTVERGRNEAITAREFLATQIPATEAALREAEERLRQFREARGVVDLEEEAKSAVEVVAELDRILAEGEGRLASVFSRIAELEAQLDMSVEKAIAVSSVSQAPGIQTVLEELQSVETSLSVNLTRFQPDSPTVVSLQGRATALRQLLQSRVRELTGVSVQIGIEDLQAGDLERALIEELAGLEAERLGLSSNLNAIRSNRAKILQRANSLPGLEQEQQQFERELEAIQTTYENLLARREQLVVAENQGIVNASILESARVPLKPSTDKTSILLGLTGIVFGGLAAVATAFVREVADRSIKTSKGVREIFSGYLSLGTIPAFSRARKSLPDRTALTLPLRDAPNAPLSEMYRKLQTNLELQTAIDRPTTVTLASSVPGEGKSTIAANLAMAVAELGRRVLLVDADLRNPSQAALWELSAGPGLVEAISGKCHLADALQTVQPYLDILPAGQLAANPTSLLQSRSWSALLQQAAEQYDFIAIDTPPLAVAADALIVGHLSDGILMVARPGSLDSSSAIAAKTALSQSNQTVLGVVLNAIDAASAIDSSFEQLQRYYASSTYKLRPALPPPGS
ncbi:polysaccharide biosynthesis tyrosine autokinase [Synechococcus sp. PCC 7336]|uniref:GumC family protein n=1 Tax=Synechococcus sp. PCC 7336 TaxID=195250 RepID=UPI0003469050|nr:polysaccharide biosynthesis tyrosine autokinase [Synechococcus sp. PCC 7336]